ncbi:Dynein light chain [Spironucleus salmonicida]|uniref:Dynein light chain n=1 Tax=Spironucleus salmonicida TaxID=348837 RepID=V6LQL0_9EUKA|nr:Dynein light chain [Spironucleus salmonicida]|eukprot:EST45991.1 Dynein light chain [Spironucleus salmonicida]
MSDRQIIIKLQDMPEDMQGEAQELASQAMERFVLEKDISAYIKKEFDKKFQPCWHVLVGKNFTTNISHEAKRMIYFYVGQLAFLIFKSG